QGSAGSGEAVDLRGRSRGSPTRLPPDRRAERTRTVPGGRRATAETSEATQGIDCPEQASPGPGCRSRPGGFRDEPFRRVTEGESRGACRRLSVQQETDGRTPESSHQYERGRGEAAAGTDEGALTLYQQRCRGERHHPQRR